MKDIFQNAGLEKPTKGFTDSVMAKINASEAPIKATPLITLKGWVGIAAGIIALISLTFFVPTSGTATASKASPYLDKGAEFLNYALGNLGTMVSGSSVPTWAWMLGIAILFFWGIDQLMKKSWKGVAPIF